MQPGTRSAILVTCILALAAGRAEAQGLLKVLDGPSAGELFGYAVSGVGDVDQDGLFDLVVGARAGLDPAGVPTGSVRILSARDGAERLYLHGAHYADFFGFSVAGPGDVDGDGVPDVLVGAPQGEYLQFNNGTAEVFSGATGQQRFVWGGLHPNTEFGHAVAGATDLDLDGIPDILVGTWRDHPNGLYSGAVFVMRGSDGQSLHYLTGDEANDYVGWSVCAVPDVDGDGVWEIATGCIHDDAGLADSGAVRLYSGATGQLLWKVGGDEAQALFGYSVAPAGDVDGDGIGDVAAGAPLRSAGRGRVRILSGATGQTLLDVDGDPSSRLGWSLARIADLDGDGADEVAAGAPRAQSSRGRVRVFSAATGQTLFELEGDPGSEFGHSVANAGDANGDLVPDLLVGAPFDDQSGTDAGQARLHSPVCGDALSYGGGCGGALGPPALVFDGCLTPGAPVQVSLQGGPAGAPAFLLFGTGQKSIQFGPGCPLQIAPLLPPVLGFALDGSGQAALPGLLPTALPGGTTFTVQAIVADSGSTGGYSASNPLLVVIE